MESDKLAKPESSSIPEAVHLSYEVVKRFICPKANDQEIYFFLELCRAQRLNPFLKEVYLIKYSDNEPAAMVTGKETFMKRAARSEHYTGFKAGIIVMSPPPKELITREGGMKYPGEVLLGGWCEVLRDDRTEPIRIEVAFEEYVAMKPIRENGEIVGEEPNKFWRTKPATMIRKVAVAQAHREAFPQELGDMLLPEELPIEVELPTYSLDRPQPGSIEPPRQKTASTPADSVTTKVKEVVKKEGPLKDGKISWTKYTLDTEHGAYSTFDTVIAANALSAKNGKLTVMITYRKTEKYGNEIETLSVAGAEGKAEQG